ncbi:glutamate-cysteine ligase catalytic subunit [Thelephora ganbajun]|uniref:Glutamate-cysteine ligase catalytic subunit n=1 Tax=Thelephora ganbajun TaxID=370292 RepID=A0ACB6ZB97_THEGA|nr:glutamate-cysteine ligase catalytic subunit [Thelephora ganbajun]
MGLLSFGTPLAWKDTKKLADHIRSHGITQFLHTWDRVKDRCGDELFWGDEVEYMVASFDDDTRSVRLSLRQTEILAKLQAIVNDISCHCPDNVVVPLFHPEYGRFMLESTPGAPYSNKVTDLLMVEGNMRYRRSLAQKHLKKNEVPLTLTSYPRLGAPGQFTDPYFNPVDAVSSHSLFLPEEITNPHARFPTLTANIRSRRGSKVAINLPIFVDKNTPRPFIDPTIPWERNVYPEDPEAKNGAALCDHVYMDAMCFGMGCCCLQVTFQACSVTEARRIYDSFVPLAPIFLALTAASPLWRGYITDVDARWNVVSASVDDRTEEERGLKPLKNDRYRIPKSRYDSVSLYISDNWLNRPEYNDVEVPNDPEIYERLRDHGIDDILAKHVSHLFIRDPLVIFSELKDQDDENSMDHFENIQSTNWQTVRFKPPPIGSSIGWRVEFRPMEIQMTDFENAAFAIFFVLLTRAILSVNLNFYMPISKVDENMQRAQHRDALQTEKFYFRKDIFLPNSSRSSSVTNSGKTSPAGSDREHNGISNGSHQPKKTKRMGNCFLEVPPPPEEYITKVEDEYEEMTVAEVMNGKGHNNPGLITLVYEYVDTLDINDRQRSRLFEYLDFVRERSTGKFQTPATWIRNFVRSHPAYKFDSVVSEEINYDLLKEVDEIERGVKKAPELLPEYYTGRDEDQGSIGL